MTRILVMGPHGSGNRLNNRMLEAYRAVDDIPVKDWEIGVLSFPGQIPPVKGWDVADFLVLSYRGSEATAESMLKERMVKTIEHAREWVEEARGQVEEWSRMTMVPSVRIYYEDTVENGAWWAIEKMALMLGVEPWAFDERIYDGNAKYR